ncbi:MAG: adenylate cyclase [Candidatus Ozemobacteraceae bacterium]
MPLEIERKFLVCVDRLPKLEGGTAIIQGYLSLEPQVRFRIIGETVTLSVKSVRSGNARFEFEAPRENVSQADCVALCDLAVLPLIEKTRFRIGQGDLVWEIDQYSGRNSGLITTEVEIPYSEFPLHPPEWVRFEKEVTNEERYFNTHLARYPFSEWSIIEKSDH